MAKVLLGFMGAGKSTIARGLDPDFVDMDALLEERLGMPIARFFAEKGEAAFRQIEEDTSWQYHCCKNIRPLMVEFLRIEQF